MKLTTRTLLLLGGLTVPPLLAVTFLFGCCILPFHHYLHRVMPMCHLASSILSGHSDSGESHHHPVAPPREKQKVAGSPSLLSERATSPLLPFDAAVRFGEALARAGARSRLSPGAARCDDDVGLELLLNIFRV